MSRKVLLTVVAGATLALAVLVGSAMAFAHHGSRHGDMGLGILAHAAGLTHDQIRTAFMSDTALKQDFNNVIATKQTMDTCIVGATSATACNGQIQAYAAAEQALATEKNTVWEGLFASAPNKSAASTLKGQLDSLESQKHQLLHQAFSSAKGSDSTNPPADQE